MLFRNDNRCIAISRAMGLAAEQNVEKNMQLERFNYPSLKMLQEKIQALGVDIPLSERLDILGEPLAIGEVTVRNRLAIQPMEGCDGTPEGEPGELTVRRYERFARGGAGLLWFEAVAIMPEGRASPRQLWINEQNLDSFRHIVNLIKELSFKEHGFAPLLIMQATHSGRYSKPESLPAGRISDDELRALEERFGQAARLAAAAGFDGIDVKCCHGYLLCELLSGYNRPGMYGGSFENRTRLLIDGVRAARAGAPHDFIVTSRLNIYDGFAWPEGFGMDPSGGLGEDMTEPLRLMGILHNELGMDLLNITMGCPYTNPHVNRPFDMGPYEPPEHPLEGVARMVRLTGQAQRAFPGLAVVASGPSYLRQYGAQLAAGAIEQGHCKLVGFGRQAFAYPEFAHEILQNGAMDPGRCCLCCGKCSQLMRAGSTAGCVARDEVYRGIYRRDVTA